MESAQLNLGLYTTRVIAKDLRRASEEAEGTVPPLAEVEAALPTIIVYLALGKFFMRGLLAGSLKG